MAKSPKSLNDLLDRDQNTFAHFQQKTRQFRQIHELLSNLVGDNIAQNILVSNFNNCILTLETPNPAVAHAFKMQQSQMLSAMRQQINPATVTIEIKVSPKSTNTSQLTRSKSTAPAEVKKASKVLPEETAQIISSIAEGASDKLKASLLRLAVHKKP